jgi:hypothetical protein
MKPVFLELTEEVSYDSRLVLTFLDAKRPEGS